MPKLIRLQSCSRMTCMEYKSSLRPLLPVYVLEVQAARMEYLTIDVVYQLLGSVLDMQQV